MRIGSKARSNLQSSFVPQIGVNARNNSQPLFILVLESPVFPKQGGSSSKEPQQPLKTNTSTFGNDEQKPKVSNEAKDNVALGSKGKEKILSDEPIVDNSEVEESDENEVKRRKAQEAEMDEHQSLNWEAEAKDMNWLEPITSFDLENSQISQFDMPITPRAFLFRSFDVIANAPATDENVDNSLMEFYISHAKP
ncbi:unnamed protein product [Lactuca saligna]|uniref:Uncharacterized protein n=1 Tax=Lactuca saligna TaxID=75948 RepID=A0AA35YZT9_LACSI|nr:unnamed protein product [Lactuca saligna]